MSDTSTPGSPDEPAVDPTAERMPPATVAALFVQHGDELRRFLYGVLRNNELVNDALQVTFLKTIERGHTARQATIKGWLFRVAYHEAIVVRRKQALDQRATGVLSNAEPRLPPPADVQLIRWDDVTRVREALRRLPPEQRRVVEMRIYDEKKFIEIADELKLPLGTVLTRMQLALQKLKAMLGAER